MVRKPEEGKEKNNRGVNIDNGGKWGGVLTLRILRPGLIEMK